jgi:hypothetical protein
MKSVSIWHPILTIIGMAAWALFILGCIDWSSWSPDGSNIVFPYVTSASNHRNWGLALYDSNGRTVTPIFIQPVDEHEKHNKLELMQAQWTSDGSRVLINLIRETELEFLVCGALAHPEGRNVVRGAHTPSAGRFRISPPLVSARLRVGVILASSRAPRQYATR